MKKNIIQLCTLGAMLLVASCSKAEPEIITEDPTYKIDPKEVYVDTPAKFLYNTDNILRNESDRIIALEVKVIDGVAEINTETIPLTFRLRRPLTKDLVITLEQDNSLLSRYAGDRTNVQEFPEGTFEGLSVTIPAGTLTHTANIQIKNVNQLTNTNGYLTAFRFVVPTDVNMAEEAKVMYVRANVTEPEILAPREMPQDWTEVDVNRYYFSPAKSTFYNSWTSYRNTSRITIVKNATNPAIAGLAIRMNSIQRRLKTVQIRAYDQTPSDGETFDLITLSEPRDVVYIRFVTPLTHGRIDITGLTAFAGTSVEIHDIKVYSKQ